MNYNYNFSIIAKLLFVIILFSCLLSCSKEVDQDSLIYYCLDNIFIPHEDSDLNNLLINRAKYYCYNANHYSYHFKYNHGGCINNELYVEVLHDSILNIEIIELSEFTPYNIVCVPETMEELFKMISDAVDKNIEIPRNLSLCDPIRFPFANTCQLADRVRIEYDELYGIPLSINIDYNSGWADEEYIVTISNFELIR